MDKCAYYNNNESQSGSLWSEFLTTKTERGPAAALLSFSGSQIDW